jgi:hypothetical protein
VETLSAVSRDIGDLRHHGVDHAQGLFPEPRAREGLDQDEAHLPVFALQIQSPDEAFERRRIGRDGRRGQVPKEIDRAVEVAIVGLQKRLDYEPAELWLALEAMGEVSKFPIVVRDIVGLQDVDDGGAGLPGKLRVGQEARGDRFDGLNEKVLLAEERRPKPAGTFVVAATENIGPCPS